MRCRGSQLFTPGNKRLAIIPEGKQVIRDLDFEKHPTNDTFAMNCDVVRVCLHATGSMIKVITEQHPPFLIGTHL